MTKHQLTTGVPAIDDLIDQVRVGDNLVFTTSHDAAAGWLLQGFISSADPARLVVVDATGRHREALAATTLDWSAKRRISFERARAQLTDVDAHMGGGALYAIDSLTDLAQRWGGESALDLFLWACPRLYRRRSVALWVIARDRHDDAFMQRLTDVTQVVVDVVPADSDSVQLTVKKADGRAPTIIGRSATARLLDGELVEVGPVESDRRRLGAMLRELRESHRVGQADLARRVGISASALSQAERGVRTVSAETLMRIYEALGVTGKGSGQPGYRVIRRSAQGSSAVAGGVTGRRVTEGDLTIWQLTVDGRAEGRHGLFPVKSREVVSVLRGVFEVEVGGERITLHEGDALDAATAAVTAWRNPADTPAELVWVIAA